jgi:hypothetical protein
MHRIPAVISAAVLLAGFAASTAHAQGVFSPATYAVSAATGDVTGGGAGTFVGPSVPSSAATLTLSATGGSVNDIGGTITEALTGVDATIIAGSNTTTITGATGVLTVASGDLVYFSDTTLGTAATTYPGLTVSDLEFNFTASTDPTVTGGTTIAPGIVVGGSFGADFGDAPDGVVTVNYSSAVPEPGMVSMLVGLVVTGTGLGLRRLRRRAV